MSDRLINNDSMKTNTCMKGNKNECNMYIIQKDAQNYVFRLNFPLDALHVSDCISPSSGATFISCTSHLLYADTIGLAVVWL